MPITECCVRSKASSTPAAAMREPPAPKNCGTRPSSLRFDAASSAETSSAASKSPLASPAMSMKVFGFILNRCRRRREESLTLILFSSNRRSLDVACVGLPEFGEDSPKLRPIIFRQRIQFRIAGDHTTGEWPDFISGDQFRPHRIRCDVKADFGERIPFPLLLTQN